MVDETTTEQLAEIEGQAEDTPVTGYTPPTGWRVLKHGEVLQPGDQWVNWEGTESRPDILHGDGATVSGGRYIRDIAAERAAERSAATIEELRSEVSHVQRLLGESRQRVTTLEELVTSLRNINAAQKKGFDAANKANDDLEHRLNTVTAEWSQQAEVIRQLRADLEQATRERDQYSDSYQRILGDLETIRETTAAETVEAIAEWLQAFRGCNSPALALLLLEALPSIMRSLTGLADDEDVD